MAVEGMLSLNFLTHSEKSILRTTRSAQGHEVGAHFWMPKHRKWTMTNAIGWEKDQNEVGYMMKLQTSRYPGRNQRNKEDCIFKKIHIVEFLWLAIIACLLIRVLQSSKPTSYCLYFSSKPTRSIWSRFKPVNIFITIVNMRLILSFFWTCTDLETPLLDRIPFTKISRVLIQRRK